MVAPKSGFCGVVVVDAALSSSLGGTLAFCNLNPFKRCGDVMGAPKGLAALFVGELKVATGMAGTKGRSGSLKSSSGGVFLRD